MFEPVKLSYEDFPEALPEEYRKTLKAQIDYDLKPQDVKCPNPDHVLIERNNGELACVFSETAKKLIERDWASSTW